MKTQLTRRFWAALIIFSLMGQIAWVVENMYFNVFIYKMFHASAGDISLMVGASSVAATATTILVGAFTDYIGRRKRIICGGYIAWGVSILAFAFLRVDLLSPIAGSALAAASLGITLVIILDCVMTFLGSSANDAGFNAWMTDWGDEGTRGKIEGINSMMPLIAILVVFGGFSVFDLERPESWTAIYLIVGIAVTFIGILGIFLIEEKESAALEETSGYYKTLVYSFRPSVLRQNSLLYAVIGAFALFGISINIFMPYLILYYEKTLGMENYVLIMAPAIIIAAVITAFYGKLFDLLGFKSSVLPAVGFLMAGYVLLYAGTGTGIVFLGSLLMMTGYLTGMAIFGAMIRSRIPEHKAGQFQGIRIIGQVLVPGIIGPAVGAAVLQNAEQIVNSDGTTSFLPNRNIFLAAFGAALLLLACLFFIFQMMQKGHHTLVSQAGEALLAQRGRSGQDISSRQASFGPGSSTIWSGYPRPQLRRKSFLSLNGSWQLNRQEILVPFPPQSLLSGYGGHVGKYLEYRKTFSLAGTDESLGAAAEGSRLLLHFGAVDQIAEVFLNGCLLGRHEGGYLPFFFDITPWVNCEKDNELLVKVRDTLSPRYPYGKQRKARGGMWYTPVSGIWQSVWLERVPSLSIERLHFTADTKTLRLSVQSSVPAELETEIAVTLHNGTVHTLKTQKGQAVLDLSTLRLPDGTRYRPVLWDTKHPYLYEMTVTLGEDTVSSYFALRTIEVSDQKGLPRVCLNGNPIFLHGVLDQGYFCDGIFLPATEQEYEQDILRMKELGINLLRKHIKIEPECFYYYCDLHGMLVMQDMVNSGLYSWLKDTALPTLGVYPKGGGALWSRKKRRSFFLTHMEDTIRHLQNHPSVVAYTLFNEGWGQFDGDAVYEQAKKLDDSRLYDTASGWFPPKKSDFDSQHIYYKPLVIPSNVTKPILVSECGGYSYPVPHHFYAKYVQFGYGSCKNSPELTRQILSLYETKILPQIPKGVCGCIYTQLSDVEDETNGFYTYDRKVCKVEKESMQQLARQLSGRLGRIPTSIPPA